MGNDLYIVTGALGAGKSVTLDAFLALHTPHIAFDIDWLAAAASALAHRSILHDPTTWRPYRAVWFEVLHAIIRNSRVPVLFAAIDPHDVAELGPLAWCDRINWFLLDCDDRVRRERLRQRPGWTAPMMDEALADAAALRAGISTVVDTGHHPPRHVAERIAAWLERARDDHA
jgi:hypothetical protein